MAGSYHDFVSARTTQVDQAALLTTLRARDPSYGFTTLDSLAFRVKKATSWTGTEITQVQTDIDTAPAITTQRQAQAEIDAWPIAERALVLALIDQLNVIRSKLSPPLGDITPAQALAAIRAKAGTL